MKYIKLAQTGCVHGELYAIVDDEDFEELNRHKWCAVKGKRSYYAIRSYFENGKRITLRMHRVLLGITDRRTYGDHINHNGLDNRKENLRIATTKQNVWNRRKRIGAKFKYYGISLNGKKYRAYIGRTYLGSYETQEMAARVYDKAAKEQYGEFAKLNFP